MNPDIDLHIEELVLHGFSPGDRYRIGEAVERELAGLLAGEGLPVSLSRGGELGRVDGGEFKARPAARPETIGSQVAKSVYDGLKR